MKKFFAAMMVLGFVMAVPAFADDSSGPGKDGHRRDEGGSIDIRNTVSPRIDVDPRITVSPRIDVDPRITVSPRINPEITVSPRISNKQGQKQYQGQDQEQDQKQKQGQFQIGINKQGQNNNQVINPEQTVTFVSPREYLAAPALTVAPGATRPYEPKSYIHGPGLLLPTHMTFVQADSCRAGGISDDWDGNSLADEASEITLWYPNLKAGEAFPVRFTHYLGTAMSETDSDHAFVTAVCEAAYRAMEEGANMGIVTFKIRPRSKSWGVGLPASGAASSTGGLAGTAGMALGVSNAYVKGDLFVHITSFTRDPLVFTGN